MSGRDARALGTLFSGIGVPDLAWHLLGGECAWAVEKDAYCQRVLRARFPGLTVYGDIFEVRDLPSVDVIVAGFPCQPFSVAGKRQGQNDERYLVPEMLRVIGEVQPRVVVFENVPGFASIAAGDTFKQFLGALAEMGFDAEWGHLAASDFGAPHRRERWFCVAYRDGVGRRGAGRVQAGAVRDHERHPAPPASGRHLVVHAPLGDGVLADAAQQRDAGRYGDRRSSGRARVAERAGLQPEPPRRRAPVADAQGVGQSRPLAGRGGRGRPEAAAGNVRPDVGHADRAGRREQRRPVAVRAQQPAAECTGAFSGAVADAPSLGRREGRPEPARRQRRRAATRGASRALHERRVRLPDADGEPLERSAIARAQRRDGCAQSCVGRDVVRTANWLDGRGRWPARPGEPQYPWEPPRTVPAGLPNRAARLKALGNSMVLPVLVSILASVKSWLDTEVTP